MPQLYDELAEWWHLFSPPEEYRREADFFHSLFSRAPEPPHTMLELGSGGGNNASHLKAHYALTLVDISPRMLAVSRELNPQCEHVEGDMRTVRLGRTFDAVFVHDAICYMTTSADLRAAIETAFLHCRDGGTAIFAPDHVRENFVPTTDHSGEDGDGRAIRYLEWTYDPDPSDSTYDYDFALLFRNGEGTRAVFDHHVCGLFGRDEWLALLRGAGFEPSIVIDEWGRENFVGHRGPRSLARDADLAELVIDAMQSIGKQRITSKGIATLRDFVRQHGLAAKLKRRARRAPSWMVRYIDEIVSGLDPWTNS